VPRSHSRAMVEMSRAGRSSPDTPGVFTTVASAYRVVYCPLTSTTNTTGNRCWTAVRQVESISAWRTVTGSFLSIGAHHVTRISVI
jgi:hypothetical protein